MASQNAPQAEVPVCVKKEYGYDTDDDFLPSNGGANILRPSPVPSSAVVSVKKEYDYDTDDEVKVPAAAAAEPTQKESDGHSKNTSVGAMESTSIFEAGWSSDDCSYVYSDDEINHTLNVIARTDHNKRKLEAEYALMKSRSFKMCKQGTGTANAAKIAPSNMSRVAVFTITADNDMFARIRILSTQTIYDLMVALMQYTANIVNFRGGIDLSQWVFICNGKEYDSLHEDLIREERKNQTMLKRLNLEERTTLTLLYGSTTEHSDPTNKTHQIQLSVVKKEVMPYFDYFESQFPTNQPETIILGMPPSYEKYQPNVAYCLGIQFPHLNKWLFQWSHGIRPYLFATDKYVKEKESWKEEYGCGIVSIPIKPDNLANWLECLNQGMKAKEKITVIPRSKVTPQVRDEYSHAEIIEEHAHYAKKLKPKLEDAFPKCAALAGFKKDENIPEGFIDVTRRAGGHFTIEIFASRKFVEEDCDNCLFKIIGQDFKIRGLHDLFCIVEGLLRTL